MLTTTHSDVRGWPLRRAAQIIEHGGVIAYPTEAVYGLGCNPMDADAVYRLLELKQRDISKGLIVIAADYAQLLPYIEPPDSAILQQLLASWPGPMTWLVKKRPTTPFWLSGTHTTLAVRVTAHPLAAALCRQCGHALVSTSANISHHAPATSALQVRCQFGNSLDYILHGALGRECKPTQIRDAQSGKIIRAA